MQPSAPPEYSSIIKDNNTTSCPPPYTIHTPIFHEVVERDYDYGTSQIAVESTVEFGEHPVHINCPYCHKSVFTKMEKNLSILSWILSGLFCLLCLIPCALVTLCVGDFMDIIHYCPNCDSVLGHYSRM